MANHICTNCHNEIPFNVHPYTMKIQLYPSVEESLQITEADLAMDFKAEIKKIVDSMEAMREEEVRLEHERVYSSFSFVICPQCRDALASMLRKGRVHESS